MNQAFTAILQQIAAEQGKEALLNPAKCKSFLADYTRNEYKKESRLLLQAIEANTVKAIDSATDIILSKRQQVKVLQEEYFLAEEIASDLVDTLAFVLRGDTSKTEPSAANAGNNNKTLPPLPPLPPHTDFVRVEGGTFQMGSNNGDKNEKPVHSVKLKSFCIGKYEVTQKEWVTVMGHNPSNFKGDNRPVETVSWDDAVEYCNKRSQQEGLTPAYRSSNGKVVCDFTANGYRLPTEAEWEFAAKGGNKDLLEYTYSGSNNIEVVAWYNEDIDLGTHDVGTKAPNSLGIYDMSGNVYEWCWDKYGKYSGFPQTNPTGASSGSDRVIRGGSYHNSANFVRSVIRIYIPQSKSDYDLGFRLVRNAD